MEGLTIRRDVRFPAVRYLGTAGKPAAAGPSRAAANTAGATVSDSLRRLMAKGGQAEALVRESQKTLQTGRAVLAEVQDKLERMAQLAQQAAGDGENVDREALQAELEQLRSEIERMIGSAVVGDLPLFLDGDLGELGIEDAADLLRQLLELAGEGITPDQATALLTDGEFTSLADFLAQFTGGTAAGLEEFLASPGMLALLAGLQGEQLDLLLELFRTVQEQETARGPEGGPVLRQETNMANAADGAPARPSAMQLGDFQVVGRDLSQVSFDAATGTVTVSGGSDVTIRGGRQEQAVILLSGSGTVTLQDVKASKLVIASDQARVFTEGDSELTEVELREGASLTLDGGGRLKTGVLRGDRSNVLRLAGGAVIVEEDSGESPARDIPVIVEGPASLAARPDSVKSLDGKPLEPFDVLWKALLPGWSAITSLQADGRQAKMSLYGEPPDPVRIWLEKLDSSHGFSLHTLLIQGKDKMGRPKTRYAYLNWNRRAGAFQEVSMYPNPFTVTGGEQGEDWVYEEASHTLTILSSRVTALSGGSGMDANQEPFSGRVVLADRVGTAVLALDGVVCRVSSGRACRLGRDNNVTLILNSGAENVFESGAGCPGISLGENTTLSIDCADPDGVLAATVGAEVQGAGISLQMGEESVTLPQFRLSSRALQLDRLCVSTREAAQAAGKTLEADRHWVSRLQAAYGALYSQLEPGTVRGTAPAAMLPRSVWKLLRE